MRHTIQIQPMSLNNYYFNAPGRGRVKTTKARSWSEQLYYLIPMCEVPDEPFGLHLRFGTPHYNLIDLDNLVKPVVDIMQAKWGFNDKAIDFYILEKRKTKKGCGYIEFEILIEAPIWTLTRRLGEGE